MKYEHGAHGLAAQGVEKRVQGTRYRSRMQKDGRKGLGQVPVCCIRSGSEELGSWEGVRSARRAKALARKP